jgi:hypothetical protein
MTVIQMSDRELSRLRVMIDLGDGRLTLEAAGALMDIGRRQVFRLRRAFEGGGASGSISQKRGGASNHRRGETIRHTALALIREHYPDFDPTSVSLGPQLDQGIYKVHSKSQPAQIRSVICYH